ncbi:MAG TPA: tripartite tricarboxylate transporter substrate binding protein [Burkholderiaceae bacterium]|nr:tripartite tricarboxylate transporter substrate binding protein [Burkholderiaceae bacterium]
MTPSSTRRSHLRDLLALAAALGSALFAPAAGAQSAVDFPNRPVTLITPFAPGSGPDAVLRLIADKLGKVWNQRVVVDNKPGGGGFIAIEAARRVATDGYTLLQLNSEHLAALPHLYKQRGFVTLQTFEPVAILYRTPFLVTVSSSGPYKTLGDLVGAAKAAPGKLSYGSWGVGSPGHLGGEQLEEATGTKMSHVAFRDIGQLYGTVASGELAWAWASIPSSQGVYKAGKLRYLAVAAPKRLPQLPEVPTVGEAGGPAGFDVSSFVVLVTPRGLAPALRAKINADVAHAVADPEVKARFDAFAFDTLNWSPEDIVKQADAKSKVYEALVQRGNISLE